MGYWRAEGFQIIYKSQYNDVKGYVYVREWMKLCLGVQF